MHVKSLTFNPFQENTYIVYDETKECVIIDPGCYEKTEELQLESFITTNRLTPKKLVNTHCHIDHILGNKFVCDIWNTELYIHKKDLYLLENSVNIAKMYGFENYKKSPHPNFFLEEKNNIEFGNSKLQIIFTPGHSPGHICLYSEKNKFVIGGDVLFKGSIGRTDLPGGDHNQLINSIKTKLLPLAKETKIYCGHGPSTNLDLEKKHNPFLQ